MRGDLPRINTPLSIHRRKTLDPRLDLSVVIIIIRQVKIS